MPMSSKALLPEAQRLKDVCRRLEVVTEQQSHVSDALLTICGTIRSTATILEVLVATKLGGGPDRMV